ncbi:phosphoglycerate dehydrogenase, partial [Methylobacterium radiotolerans]
TPHLGASTDEAQEKAGISVAKSVRLALAGELVPDAVNVAGGVITPHLGASTDEAQEKAGISVAKSVRLALAGELV